MLSSGAPCYEGKHLPNATRSRGDPASREFIAFWLKDERVMAGMNVNVWDVNEHIQELIRARRSVDRRRLADPGTPLEDVLGGTRSAP